MNGKPPMQRGGTQSSKNNPPQYAVPGYIKKGLIKEAPPGHRFLLYFKGWNVGDKKRSVLKDVCENTSTVRGLLENIHKRQAALTAGRQCGVYGAELVSPLATGLGNPHPVENGFAFLSPYGVPYLPGAGVKGVVRRAAEELALFAEDSPWTIPLVWALFGFEAGSAYLAEVPEDRPDVLIGEARRWQGAFNKWGQEKADDDPLLRAWLKANTKEDKRPPSEVLRSWLGKSGETARRDVHWQGLLRFWDAFPEKAELDVDILNPHHKAYYEGNGSPHDAESPVPVFFLVLKPGVRFRFVVEMTDRRALAGLPDWKPLLNDAFNHAFDWLGFGAKTAVGYGAMKVDDEAEERLMQERQRAEETQRREEAERKRREEERKRKEELASLPEEERLVRMVKDATPDQQGEDLVNTKCYPRLDALEGDAKEKLAQALKDFYKRMDKWDVNKKKKKQFDKVQKIKGILGE